MVSRKLRPAAHVDLRYREADTGIAITFEFHVHARKETLPTGGVALRRTSPAQAKTRLRGGRLENLTC